MQIFMARVVAPEGHSKSEVIVAGTWSQGNTHPLMVQSLFTVEPVDVSVDVDVDVEVDVMEDSSDVDVDVMEDSSVLLLVTQGLASLISAWLHPRSVGGNRKVIAPPSSTTQPGQLVELKVMADPTLIPSMLMAHASVFCCSLRVVE